MKKYLHRGFPVYDTKCFKNNGKNIRKGKFGVTEMDQFLLKVKREFTNWDCSKWNRILHIIIGNESCDLDSAVSAIAHAWYKSQVCNSALFVPILNIPKHQFRLKTEITFLFKKLNIEEGNILFNDQVDFKNLTTFGNKKFHVTLVDHHILSPGFSYMDPHVKAIIDHRPIQCSFSDKIDVKIESTGSCCSLIAESILSDLTEENIIADIKLMLLGAILVDTNNLKDKAKVTEKDKSYVAKLQIPEIDSNKLQKELKTAKFSVEGLGTRDMILKDPKYIENSTLKIMFSSLHQTQLSLIQRTDFINVITRECSTNGLTAWFSLAMIEKNEKGETWKPISIYCTDKTKKEKIVKALVDTKSLKIELSTQQSIHNDLSLLRMCNCNATRKQLIPVLNQILL